MKKQTKGETLDHTPLTFGKYKGKTPSQVAEENPGWLVWAYENVKNFPTCSELLYRDCKKESRIRRAAEKEHDDEEEHAAGKAYGYMGW